MMNRMGLGGCVVLVSALSCGGDSPSDSGTAGVVAGIDFEQCFACGDMACPTQASSCDGAAGCRELLNCAFSCEVGDVACTQACLPTDQAQLQQWTQGAAAYPAYLSCAITSCVNECTANATGGTVTGTATGAATGTATGAATGTPMAGTLQIAGMANDYVAATDNVYGIQGSFFAYSDCDTNGDGVDDPGMFVGVQCTQGWALNTTNPGLVCISGTVGVRMDTTNFLDWGAGFGMNLNELAPAAGQTAGVAQPYNATANGVSGFSFDIVALPGTSIALPANTVVEFPNPALDGTGEEHFASVRAGTNSISFASLRQATWVTSMRSFDPTQILAMKWKVESQETTSNNVSFCVTNITPL